MRFSWVNGDFQSHGPIYFEANYLRLFSTFNQTQLKVLRIDASNGTAYLPLELTSLGNGKWEAASSYGYGGLWAEHLFPLSVHDWDALINFLATEQIICVFLRHAPFIQNQLYWPIDKRKSNRKTYARLLERDTSMEQFCVQIDQKLRWSVHAAQRQHVRVEFYPAPVWRADDVAEFYQLYRQLMLEKETNAFYEFSEAFFLEHAQAFGEQCELGIVRDPELGKIIAGSLFLLDKTGWAHYHLSASDRRATATQTVELLLAEAIVRYGNLGYQWLHLGGGHALDESDGLSKFKKKFATTSVDFEISTWVCDEAAYQHERQSQPLKHPSYFLIHDARGIN